MSGLVPFNGKQYTGFSDFYGMLDDFFNTNLTTRRSLLNDTFKLDVEEGENEYRISAELPGVAKEEVGLDLIEGRLTISVRREEHTVSDEKRNYVHRERRLSSMSRAVYLPEAKHDGITAKLENGVLCVAIPKQEKAQRARKIEIA